MYSFLGLKKSSASIDLLKLVYRLQLTAEAQERVKNGRDLIDTLVQDEKGTNVTFVSLLSV